MSVDNDGRGFEMISLELLSEGNSLDVYAFETENREYFERNLPPRPANYFDLEGFKEITRELLTEQRNRDVYMHLIRDSQGVMVGRINLNVLEGDRKTAELGYRIGENVSNLGYASEAVKLVLDKAFTTYGFNRIIAGTARDNLASQRALLKNGFTFGWIIENDLKIHNEWVDTAVFEITRS
ncbi:acetyltransferase, GNAT family [Streptococcus oralis SK255]|uniref:Acetyltransferase, GNAT family n=2 Tax=Streptococcus TaxID=1301 RepID=F5VVZ7_STROR|nr:acetyltransferase, GNAT family [Streptococcus oralis SK255]